jgi:hypothetical protein
VISFLRQYLKNLDVFRYHGEIRNWPRTLALLLLNAYNFIRSEGILIFNKLKNKLIDLEIYYHVWLLSVCVRHSTQTVWVSDCRSLPMILTHSLRKSEPPEMGNNFEGLNSGTLNFCKWFHTWFVSLVYLLNLRICML